MIPKLILIATLGLAPVQKAEEVEEPQVVETTENEQEEFDWNEWLSQWFSPSQIAMIMSWVAYAGTILGLVVKIRQLAKSKHTTAEEVKQLVLEEIKKSVSEEVAEQVKPYLDGIQKVGVNTNDVLKVFAKIMALSQVNDSASRLAILDLIGSLGVIDKTLIEEAKETIKTNEQELEENKLEALDQIEEIIENTEVDENDGTSI